MEKKKSIAEEYLCPVCMQLLYKAASTTCQHHFCLSCLEQVIELDLSCPICRTSFPETYKPTIDPAYNDFLLEKLGLEMKIREEEAKKTEAELIKIKFLYGNKHQLIVPPKGQEKRHRWTAFVKCAINEASTGKYIKSVTYKLHPTFYQPIKVLTNPPFEVTSTSWNFFTLPIIIEWHSKFGLPNKTINQVLNFEGEGISSAFYVDFNRKLLEEGQ